MDYPADQDIIHDFSDPIKADSHLTILYGNVAPEGSVAKITGKEGLRFEGRAKVYEAIVKGQVPEEPGLPESFNVLVRELQALALDVELLQQDDE